MLGILLNIAFWAQEEWLVTFREYTMCPPGNRAFSQR